ncbi:hypothetical protein Hanom_Chr12g01152601 [Helianthus anomalus]
MIIFPTPPTTQPFPTPPRIPTRPPSPKIKFTRKRKTFVVEEDDEEIQSPIPLSTALIQATPLSSFSPKSTPIPSTQPPPSIIPLAAQYPLEIHVIKGEIESFYTIEDTSQLSFPSLNGYRKPKNLDEYLKLKARQVEYLGKEKCKGKDDRTAQGILSLELSKVSKIDDYAKDLSKSMSEKPINVKLDRELRKDYLDLIMQPGPAHLYVHPRPSLWATKFIGPPFI